MSHKTDDYYEHVSLPWWLVAMLLALVLLLAACGENACGCPFGHICQPMPGKEAFVCVPAPRLGDLAGIPLIGKGQVGESHAGLGGAGAGDGDVVGVGPRHDAVANECPLAGAVLEGVGHADRLEAAGVGDVSDGRVGGDDVGHDGHVLR